MNYEERKKSCNVFEVSVQTITSCIATDLNILDRLSLD